VSEDMWDTVITSNKKWFNPELKELLQFRDLLMIFVKRDVITIYKQTIFGPLWYLAQPLLVMLIYILVFTNIANIPTDEVPPALFYLSGIIVWNYFNECLMQTSDTFYENTSIYSKVYFPRIIIPLSKIISSLLKFAIQFSLFLIIFIYIYSSSDNVLAPNSSMQLLPLYLMITAMLALGAGLLITSITVKYRDLKFVFTFMTQLFMYASPVIYPISMLNEQYRQIMFFNPLSHILEGFKYALLGVGEIISEGIAYSLFISSLILFAGLIVFNKRQQTYIDYI